MVYSIVKQPTVYNNVRFQPPRKKVWYRSVHNGRTTHSNIRLGNLLISISYFTSKAGPGYCVVVYEDGVQGHVRSLHNGNAILAHNIASAEKQTLEWVRTLYKVRN